MADLTPIPRPDVLDPSRVSLAGKRDRASGSADEVTILQGALDDACSYGHALWDEVDALRRYLSDSLPPASRTPGVHAVGASPTGPDDSEGWQKWTAAFASATSALAGPHGDSGFGRSEAEQAAQKRRSAPDLQVLARLTDARRSAIEDRGSEHASRPAWKMSWTRVAAVAAGTLAARTLVLRALHPKQSPR